MKKIMFYVICGLIVVIFGGYTCMNSRLNNLQSEIMETQSSLVSMPDSAEIFTRFSRYSRTLTTLKRNINNGTSVIENTYLPPESDIIQTVVQDPLVLQVLGDVLLQIAQLEENITSPEDQVTLDSLQTVVDSLYSSIYQVHTNIQTTGTCLEPNIGVETNLNLQPSASVGCRLLYSQRFGIGPEISVGLQTEEDGDMMLRPAIFADCRIPNWNNVSLELFVGKDILDEDGWEFGIGINFYPR